MQSVEEAAAEISGQNMGQSVHWQVQSSRCRANAADEALLVAVCMHRPTCLTVSAQARADSAKSHVAKHACPYARGIPIHGHLLHGCLTAPASLFRLQEIIESWRPAYLVLNLASAWQQLMVKSAQIDQQGTPQIGAAICAIKGA